LQAMGTRAGNLGRMSHGNEPPPIATAETLFSPLAFRLFDIYTLAFTR
jgi:hypothetical protein